MTGGENSGINMSVNACMYNDGNGTCGYPGKIHIGLLDNGVPECLSAEFFEKIGGQKDCTDI